MTPGRVQRIVRIERTAGPIFYLKRGIAFVSCRFSQ